MEKYVYPKLSQHDLLFVRFGGAGLGNLLFVFARAIVLAEETNSQIIWPTWPSIKIGPWIRKEKDKRFYGDLFKNDGSYIGGLKKLRYLLLKKKIVISVPEEKLLNRVPDNCVLVYSAFRMHFDELIPYRDTIRNKLLSISKSDNLKSLEHDFSKEVNVHVRLGDFAAAERDKLNKQTVNTRLPIDWYVQVIKDIKEFSGEEICFNIFSDGTDEELSPILSIAGTRRMFFGNAWADIIGLSQSRLMIASASSFSLWARYLGNSSCITFSNQLYENVCTDSEGFEFCYGFDEAIPPVIRDKILRLYSIDGEK